MAKFHTLDKRLRRDFLRLTAPNGDPSCSINKGADWSSRAERKRKAKREYSKAIGASRCGLSEALLAKSEMESPLHFEYFRTRERQREQCSKTFVPFSIMTKNKIKNYVKSIFKPSFYRCK